MKTKIADSRQSTVDGQQLVGAGQLPFSNPEKTGKQFTIACTSFGFKFSAVLLSLFAFATTAMAQADSMLAQQNRPAEMATTMRSNGKIYVVVTILVFILTGLFLYLIRLDRKISRLEKNN